MRKNNPTVIITHHALSQKWHTVKDVDNWHRERWPGFVSRSGWHCGYHFVIDWDGTVTKTRQFDEEGAHTLGMNTSSIGVCFMGNYDIHYPSDEQIKTWEEVYKNIQKEFPGLPCRPHRHYASYKSCHGNLLPDDYFARLGQLSFIEELKRIVANLLSRIRK